MKFSVTALIALTASLASAAPAPAPVAASSLEAMFKRQSECAAINEACLDANSQGTLASILSTVPLLDTLLDGLDVTDLNDALTCCPGSSCSGGSAALPGFLGPVAGLVGLLPYQSCTDN
ncbi:hypothetical protein V8F20_005142 [Naviculisporaceae sp. PSN 640]